MRFCTPLAQMALYVIGMGLAAMHANGADDFEAPAIVADGSSLLVSASKVKFDVGRGKEVTSIEIADLYHRLAKAEADLANLRDVVPGLIESAVAGAIAEVLTAQKKGNLLIGQRVDEVNRSIAGLPETTKTVGRLAQDVNELLAHASNITTCGSDGGLHLGDGKCAAAVPTWWV